MRHIEATASSVRGVPAFLLVSLLLAALVGDGDDAMPLSGLSVSGTCVGAKLGY